MAEAMLTTIDNPYDPFTQWDDWLAYDELKGYYTCNYLARNVRSSDELSQAEEDRSIENAIDEIVKLNLLGIYKKVIKND